MGECGTQVAFSDSGRTGDQNVEPSLQPSHFAHGGQGQRIELARQMPIDFRDAGLGDRQLCPAQSLGETDIGAYGDFVLDHEVDSLLEAQAFVFAGLHLLPHGVGHPMETQGL